MSKKRESKKIQPATPAMEAAATPMLGSEILVASLEREGVDTIFAYPGGASMEIHQALTRSNRIRTVLPRHEQGGAFAAGGYARATGRVGVCMATSGPGATNLVTGIADAYMDSVPMVAITGQVAHHMIGKSAFQETDFFGMTLPIVKHSYLVTDINQLAQIVKEAFYLARSGRPGPVVVDIPKNVQQQRIVPVFTDDVKLRGYGSDPHATDEQLNAVLDLISQAKRPVLYVGGGIIASQACTELRALAEAAGIPVTTTLMGIGAFPETHDLSLKWLGMHGTAYANWAVNEADLVLAFGVRFDDRVTGNVKKFCEHAAIVHIDIDASEINKNKPVQYPILSDIRFALKRLNELLKERKLKTDFSDWHKKIADWKKQGPLRYQLTEEVLKSQHVQELMHGDSSQVIMPQMVVEMLCELTQGEAIITTGVGQHQMWSGQFYKFTQPRHFLSSAGLGAMGFGFPAALGAKVACPDKEVIDIDGDGSFLMNIQELATARIEKINVKAIVLNNQHLGMVMQWEDRFYKGNRGHTYLGDPGNKQQVYPDFVAIAKGFGVACERVIFRRDLKAAMQRMLKAREPYLLDIIIPYTEHVLPFIKAGGTVADMVY